MPGTDVARRRLTARRTTMGRDMTHKLTFAAGAILIAASVSGVAAQDNTVREHRSVYPYPYSQPIAPGRCNRLCDNDLSPCDPVEFKAADGRCSNPAPGIR
jgi:hypothetical protein